jgi:AraC-like DNA-binding protein
MPIYMDRHDVSVTVTAEHVAQLHQQDLKIQHKFGCRGFTYWFDENRKTAFCLIEAPDKKAIQDMHDQAHGDVPNEIIEVDAKIVESFLGRIEDPEKAEDSDLNIFNDPALRTIMVIGLKSYSLKKSKSIHLKGSFQKYNKSIVKTLSYFKGRIIKQEENCFLVSFESVSKAVLCALEVQSKFKEYKEKSENANIKLKIGLSVGVPVTENDELFGSTIKFAERLCNAVKGQIVVSAEVKNLYKSENFNIFIEDEFVCSLNKSDEKFLNRLMDYTEKTWNITDLKVDDFSKSLGFSNSKLYRKMKSITGKSPNSFIKDYRLTRALTLLNNQAGNISQIAFETGFNSPAYFSKCFQETYGIAPSSYTKQSIINV